MSTLKRKLGFIALGAMMALPICSQGQSVAILKGSFYSPNLKNALSAAGANVTEISTDYTAASLASYESVIVYGNLNYTHMSELADYASAGGTLIETPWFWTNYTPDSAIDIFSHGGIPKFAETFPGVSVLSPANPLLDGVTFPGAGGFNIGRTQGNSFDPSAIQVANWSDGTAFIGEKFLGSGHIVGINLQVITSDATPETIDQSWATQLFLNAMHLNSVTATTPEPGAFAILAGFGVTGAGLFLKRSRRNRKRA